MLTITPPIWFVFFHAAFFDTDFSIFVQRFVVIVLVNMEALGKGYTGAQKEEIIEAVKQQVAVANAQELLNVRRVHV